MIGGRPEEALSIEGALVEGMQKPVRKADGIQEWQEWHARTWGWLGGGYWAAAAVVAAAGAAACPPTPLSSQGCV